MIAKLIFIILLAFSMVACNSSKAEKTRTSKENTEYETVLKDNSPSIAPAGLLLMKEKCYICHMPKPDRSKRDQMIAPPMLRVQEHYKPSFPTKPEFVMAVTDWVKNPVETNSLMPGAVRKFNLMPKLMYSDEDIKLIAETLFDLDFGDMPKMKMGHHKDLELKNGKKWKLKQASVQQIKSISVELEKFESDDISSYNQLGKDIFDNAKVLLMDKSYSEELFDQIHAFFSDVEGNMHLLIASQDLVEAKKQVEFLKIKFAKFDDYFE